MTRYVAFLRAINIGKRQVKMDRLRGLVETTGVANVSTFIASGNVIFESKKAAEYLEASIERALRADLGFDVVTMVRSADDVQSVLSFVKKAVGPPDGAMLYIAFLKSAPSALAAKAVAALSNDIDSLRVHRRELYWVCRTSFAQSTVTPSKLEKALGVPATVRNHTSVSRLMAKIGTAPR